MPISVSFFDMDLEEIYFKPDDIDIISIETTDMNRCALKLKPLTENGQIAIERIRSSSTFKIIVDFGIWKHVTCYQILTVSGDPITVVRGAA